MLPHEAFPSDRIGQGLSPHEWKWEDTTQAGTENPQKEQTNAGVLISRNSTTAKAHNRNRDKLGTELTFVEGP